MIKEKEFKSDTFRSDILSDACGFEVIISFDGSLTNKSFPNRPVGPQHLTLFIAAIVFTAGNKTVRFQQVQTEITRVEADGTVISSLMGKSVEFNGVLKTNVETGETILQSHNVPDHARKAICQRLKA
jgi:hypothetical protein